MDIKHDTAHRVMHGSNNQEILCDKILNKSILGAVSLQACNVEP
jgi:hypothetical protein